MATEEGTEPLNPALEISKGEEQERGTCVSGRSVEMPSFVQSQKFYFLVSGKLTPPLPGVRMCMDGDG